MGRPRGIKPGFSILGSKWRVAYAAYFLLTEHGLSRKKARLLVFAAFMDQYAVEKSMDFNFTIDPTNGKFSLKLHKGEMNENGNTRLTLPLFGGNEKPIAIGSFQRHFKRINGGIKQGIPEQDMRWLTATGVAWAMALLGKDHLTRQAGIGLLRFAATQGSGEAILPGWLEPNTAS